MQLWRINVEQFGDDAVKGAGQKGWYGFVSRAAFSRGLELRCMGIAPRSGVE